MKDIQEIFNEFFNEITSKKRPVCVCGEAMIVVQHIGYYDQFKYFECDNEKCSLNVDTMITETKNYGAYTY